ncbi:hypothetical protein POVWA2_079970 [Plasmodium ovale wallikeri]|uniref:Uncharacterized protein n=1 Tax=Plasmodium ovale wallikeri TaxID=864142 RepID=A0A1A9AMS5_PLAOA|nr:hypothetical protein POVWA1_081880 [Plasmodium ovale wallikeri]SBT57490.1 hypothetical protein POVWA2_079970 [Plasmodium ovale wallikeri]
MVFGVEQCKQLSNTNVLGSVIPDEIKKICECLDGSSEENKEKCQCDDISKNEDFKGALGKLRSCSEGTGGLNNLMSNKLQLITNPCYVSSLKELLSSLKTDTLCNVNISALKTKGEQIVSYMDSIGSTVTGALGYVEKLKKFFSSVKDFFSRIIEKFPGHNMLFPVGVLVFILIVIIGIFYTIIKLFRCIFCRTKKENKEDYNEQMQQLQEQYNRALQTNTQLSNFLLGYQNVS